jgi:hypothetical protein
MESARGNEILDIYDLSPAELKKVYNFIERVNRFYGGRRVIRKFLEHEVSNNRVADNICILDLASGSCDIPIYISEWAMTKGIRMEYTCLEKNKCIVKETNDKINTDKIKVLENDVFFYKPEKMYDYVTVSMFMHHLNIREIIEVINKYREITKIAFVINDLLRSPVFYLMAWFRTIFSSAVVKNDARLSIKNGFTIKEIKCIFNSIPDCKYELKEMYLYRLLGVIRF